MAMNVLCPACRNYIEDAGDFCEYCGARVSAPEVVPQISPVRTGVPVFSDKRVVIAGGIVLVVATVIVLVVRRSANSESVNEPVPVVTIAATPAPTPSPTPELPAGMVYVPGGTFDMGRNGGDEYEQPVHKVSVAPFYIDQHEVTCEEYAKFVSQTGHVAPPGWTNGKHPPGAERIPVTGVSWADATAYARWAGKRLPSEEEWEFAARGTTSQLYPWGNEWKTNCANAATTSAGKMLAVGSFADGKSPFGVLDMVGNAWEWTASKFEPYQGGRSATSAKPDLIVIRGNYWQASANQATTTFRRGYPPVNEDYTNTGFRCVKDIAPKNRSDASQ